MKLHIGKIFRKKDKTESSIVRERHVSSGDKKILIVEEEETLLDVLKDKFEAEGFKVKTVVDGDDVLAATKKFFPDMILLDLMIPNKDGFAVLEEIRDDAEVSDIPIIVFSNLDEDEDIKRALALGADDYFVKAQHSVNEIVDRSKEIVMEQ